MLPSPGPSTSWPGCRHDRGDDPLPDRSRRLIRTLTLTVFLQWVGATAIVPMLPVYIRHLGGTDALAGVVMASFFAAGVLSQYPIGRLADRIGRRPVLVAGLVTYGVASISFLLPITATMAIGLALPPGRRGRSGHGGRAGHDLGIGGRASDAAGPSPPSTAANWPAWPSARWWGASWVSTTCGPCSSPPACCPSGRACPPWPSGSPTTSAVARAARTRADGSLRPLLRIRVNRSMTGASSVAAALGLTSGVYDICWTLLLLARGASGLEIGISWTLFAVPFVLAAKPSGWLADHMDRRALVLAGIGASTVLCASYPFIHNVPALVLLGASEALGFAAAMPAVQSLLTQGSAPSEVGRVQGLFATSQTACTAVAAAAAGAAFALASWLPFVTVAALCAARPGRGRRGLADGAGAGRPLGCGLQRRRRSGARSGYRGGCARGAVGRSWPCLSWRCPKHRRERGRAVGAPGGRLGHLAQALGALADRVLVGRAAHPLHQRVDRLDHQEEDHQGHDHEREHGVEEIAVGDPRAVDGEGQLVELGLPPKMALINGVMRSLTNG